MLYVFVYTREDALCVHVPVETGGCDSLIFGTGLLMELGAHRHLPLWLLTLIFEREFLIELGVRAMSQLADKWASEFCPCPNIISVGIICTHCYSWLSHRLGTQTRVLILAWLVLYISQHLWDF